MEEEHSVVSATVQDTAAAGAAGVRGAEDDGDVSGEATINIRELLEIPSMNEYGIAVLDTMIQLSRFVASFSYLWFITMRPVLLASAILLAYLWKLARSWSTDTIDRAWLSIQQAASRYKYAVLRLICRQETLLKRQVNLLCEKQTETHNPAFFERHKQTVHRLVSKLPPSLTVALTHLFFLGGAIVIRLLFPNLVKQLVHGTWAVALFTSCYPLVATVWLIHKMRWPKSFDHSTTNLQETKILSEYWASYWIAYASVQVLAPLVNILPGAAVCLASRPWILVAGVELRALFFLWIFALSSTMTHLSQVDSRLADCCERARPLRLVAKYVVPIMTSAYDTVASAITPQWWTKMAVGNVDKLLSVFVTLSLLSKEGKQRLLNVTDELRPLLLPSLTLFMPFLITNVGLVYVQYLVPCVKTAQATKDNRLYLQYWMLHLLLSSLVSFSSYLLWFIPFSTHILFLIWCKLSMPHTIKHWYDIADQELQAFGFLPRAAHNNLDLSQTQTAKLLRYLQSRPADQQPTDQPHANHVRASVAAQEMSPSTPAKNPQEDHASAKDEDDHAADQGNSGIHVVSVADEGKEMPTADHGDKNGDGAVGGTTPTSDIDNIPAQQQADSPALDHVQEEPPASDSVEDVNIFAYLEGMPDVDVPAKASNNDNRAVQDENTDPYPNLRRSERLQNRSVSLE